LHGLPTAKWHGCQQVCPCRVTHKPCGGCSTTGASVGILVSCSHSADWGSCSPAGESPAARLRAKLATKQILTMPCCFDALSARLIERAGFEITFMSGFSTSAAKLGLPDTGYYTGLRQFTHNIPGSLRPGAAFRYISYGEMIDAGRDICAAVSIPVLGDGCPQKPACAHSRNSARCSVEAMGSADSCLCGLTALWQATRAMETR
jgi:hypothetical protein